MSTEHRFGFVVAYAGPEQEEWWVDACEDYEIRCISSHRPEWPNMRPHLAETGGLAPWTAEFDTDIEGNTQVMIEEPHLTRGNALAAGILVHAFLRKFDLDKQVLIPYAEVPTDPDERGACGGGLVEVRLTYVGETTTHDLITAARAEFSQHQLRGALSPGRKIEVVTGKE